MDIITIQVVVACACVGLTVSALALIIATLRDP